MAELLNNEKLVWGVMALITFLITQGLKWLFVKPYTKNLDAKAKAAINSVILLIAFGAAVLCEFLYSHFWLKESLNLFRAFQGWGGSSLVYSVAEQLIKIFTGKTVKIENPFETAEGAATEEFVETVIADKKIDKKDKETTKSFLNKINSIK